MGGRFSAFKNRFFDVKLFLKHQVKSNLNILGENIMQKRLRSTILTRFLINTSGEKLVYGIKKKQKILMKFDCDWYLLKTYRGYKGNQ